MSREIHQPQMDFNFPPELSRLEKIDQDGMLLADELRDFWRKRIRPEDLKNLQWLLGFKPEAYVSDQQQTDAMFLSKFEILHLTDPQVQALYLAIKSKRQLAGVPTGMLEIKGQGEQGDQEFWYSFPPLSLDVMEGVANEIERAPKRNPNAKESPRAKNLRAAIDRIRNQAGPV